jgi:long-chain acyl-CoA synthetase
MKYQNIYQLFRAQTAKYRGKPIFYSRVGDCWKSQNWEDFENQVHEFASALLKKGFGHNTKVAVLAGNVAEWAVVDVATIAIGGVGVGIYPTSSPEQCAFIINHSDAEIVFVDNRKQLQKILSISDQIPRVQEIICLEPGGEAVDFADFLEYGRDNLFIFAKTIEQVGLNAKPEDTAIMVYTSGTTGNPKGAMLSHQYILNSCESLRQTIPIYDTDVCFSYLPFCHVAERISGLYNRLYNGTPVYFVDDLAKLPVYMQEVKPTVFASLPRFFEKIYARVVSEHGKTPDAQAVKDAFGGRIRLATSGGAPLPNDIAEFFASAGLPILQAYGLTENICVAFNHADDFKFGTVGKPMPMCAVKIASDGEILVRSPMMFSGYYKEPEKTAEMFDADGWLKITGRKKEIIVLSNGKNVAPALLENLLKENHLISQAFIYGDERSFITAIITLNEVEAKAFALQKNIRFADFADLTQTEEIKQIIAEQIEKTNARVSSSEQIKKFTVLERDFSADLNEITPTLKLRRNVIANKFAGLIKTFYADVL